MPKVKKYDVIVVGAGPAGIFSCYKLINQNPKLKIALVDMGKSIDKRPKTDVMSGFGGAGTYSDGKLHFTPKLSHERTFHLITEQKYQKLLDEIEKIFKSFGVNSNEYPKNPEIADKFMEESEKNELELVIRRSKHVGTDLLKKMMDEFQKYLEDRGIDLFFNEYVDDIEIKNNAFYSAITNKRKLYGKTILLSPGRVKARWLQQLGDRHNIKYDYGMVEVGVRVEFPASVMKRHAEVLYEIVFKLRTDTYDDTMRTFCTCPNGMVAMENYEGHVCVNGHSNSDHASPNSNFAFVQEVNLTEPVENSISYAQSVAELASTIGGGKPILQRLADLRKGRRSTWNRINKSMVKPTLTDVTPGDISMALPHRVVTNIIEGLEKLDRVMPGINSGDTLLYAPEVKFRSSRVRTSSGMETDVKGVFVAGDASGMSGTITGAAATGLMAAKGIAKRLEKL